MRKKGRPRERELVICKILKIYPNSAFASLIEYRLTGMIHVSEVAKKWVKSIREFLKENQYVVCRVMRMDRGISLSVKRVRREEATRKLNEFKRERKAEKILGIAGKKLKKTIDQVYEEIGYTLQEEFGGLSKGLDTALKNPELLKSKGIPKKWREILIEIAKKNYVEKIYEVKAKLKLICYQPDGIEVIKDVLAKNVKNDMKIRYISTPEYMLVARGKNYKEAESKTETIAGNIIREINKQNGEGSFELIK